MKSIIVLLAVSSTFVSASVPLLPRATNNIALKLGFGYSPAPTTTPSLPVQALQKRAGSGSLLGYVGPDNTCGYVSGIKSLSKACAATELCAAVIVSGVASMGCCDGAGNCAFQGNCINSAEIPALCDKKCMADVNTVKCSNAAAPYCYSYIISSMTAGFFSCAASTSSSYAPFETTYLGEMDSHSWTPVYDDSTTVGGKSAPAFLPSASTANNANGLSVTVSSSSTSSTATTPAVTIKPKKKSNIGVIAGGVVGGLLLLVAIGAGVVILCVKKRQSNYPPVSKAISPPSSAVPLGKNTNVSTNQAPMAMQPVSPPTYMDQSRSAYQPSNSYPYTSQQPYYTQGHESYKSPTNSRLATSPLPYYPVSPPPPTMSPMFTPPPPDPHGPPPGVFEAGSIPIRAVSPEPAVSPQPQPVELGTGYMIPTKNAQGAPVYEAQ